MSQREVRIARIGDRQQGGVEACASWSLQLSHAPPSRIRTPCHPPSFGGRFPATDCFLREPSACRRLGRLRHHGALVGRMGCCPAAYAASCIPWGPAAVGPSTALGKRLRCHDGSGGAVTLRAIRLALTPSPLEASARQPDFSPSPSPGRSTHVLVSLRTRWILAVRSLPFFPSFPSARSRCCCSSPRRPSSCLVSPPRLCPCP